MSGCKLPLVTCGCCGGRKISGITTPHTDDAPARSTVTICWNDAPKDYWIYVLRHELTHALQNCTKVGSNNCDECLDKEIDAYLRSGMCEPGNRGWNPFGEELCDCVARQAVASCKKLCANDPDARKRAKDKCEARRKRARGAP